MKSPFQYFKSLVRQLEKINYPKLWYPLIHSGLEAIDATNRALENRVY